MSKAKTRLIKANKIKTKWVSGKGEKLGKRNKSKLWRFFFAYRQKIR